MKAVIQSVGSYIPAKRMSNDELAEIVDTSDEWIYSHTGIKYRHIADDYQASSDLGIEAAKNALKKADLDPMDIDLVLCATSTPDYIGMPSTACVIQDGIGALNAGAMDVTAVCSGFVYAMETARTFVEAGGAKHVVVVGTEVLSKIINWKDRNTCVLFGDGAGVAIVSASDDNSRGIQNSYLKAIGSGARSLMREAGGTRLPEAENEAQNYLYMDGRKVYMFAVKVLGETIQELMDKNNLTIDDIAYFVPHQANARIIEACAKRLGFPIEKFFMNIDEFANTSAATIPLALNEMDEKGLLKKGDKIITIGFGAGLTYGGNYIIW